jgi:hypothetical protein
MNLRRLKGFLTAKKSACEDEEKADEFHDRQQQLQGRRLPAE